MRSGGKAENTQRVKDLSRNQDQHQQRQANSDQIGCPDSDAALCGNERDRHPKQEKAAGGLSCGSSWKWIARTQIAGKERVEPKRDVEGEFNQDGRAKQGDKGGEQLADLVAAARVKRFKEFKADGGEDEEECGFRPHDIPAHGKEASQRRNKPCDKDDECKYCCPNQAEASHRSQLIQQCLVGVGFDEGLNQGGHGRITEVRKLQIGLVYSRSDCSVNLPAGLPKPRHRRCRRIGKGRFRGILGWLAKPGARDADALLNRSHKPACRLAEIIRPALLRVSQPSQ